MGDWRQSRRACGMTLVEVLMATAVMSVAASGVLSYEYHAAKQTQMACAYSNAVRIGHLLLQDWKANGGSQVYQSGSLFGAPSPLSSGMNFTRTSESVYKISVDDVTMQAKLSRSGSNPVLLKVTVRWRYDFLDATIVDTDPGIELMTYARIDQSGD